MKQKGPYIALHIFRLKYETCEQVDVISNRHSPCTSYTWS